MALELELETLESIDEAFQPLYKETDGKFVLEVKGLPDTKGLKTALEKERSSVKTLKEDLKRFKDVDLEEYVDLQNRRTVLEEHDPAKVEEMINSRIKKNDETWKDKFSSLEQSLQGKDAKLSNLMVSEELRKIGTELGVNGPEAMEDFVSRGKQVFQLKDDVVTPMRNGEILYGESGVEPLTMKEFGKKLSETATHLFKPSGGGGADNTGNGNAGGGTVRYKSDLKSDADKAKYIGKHGREAFLKLPEAKAS